MYTDLRGSRWSELVQPENVRDCESSSPCCDLRDLDLVWGTGEWWCMHLKPKLYRASGFVVIHSSIAADPEIQVRPITPDCGAHSCDTRSTIRTCCPLSRPHSVHTTQTRILTHTLAFWIFKTVYLYTAPQPLSYTFTHTLPIASAHHNTLQP